MPERGFFITFEGGEGAGKTTQIALFAERLRAEGRAVRVVREPGGTALGEEVRGILKHAPYGDSLDDRAEMLLFAASRAQLVAEVIRPALEAGETVICDRFADSTLAYQGRGRGLPEDVIAVVNNFATGSLVPELTVLLDLPATEGLARAHKRAAEAHRDRMETLGSAFYERVRTAYLEMAQRDPTRFFVVDARLPAAEIAEKIWARAGKR
ncbi:MAG: dTMP kinase [Puniceicoccales bacterium]|jgi:dTMP kinase|nr:dTMP kinase [Puniceicoccales bacterium]